MSPDLAEAFRIQSAACASLGSPFMARLMNLCAERLGPGGAVADRMHGWPGDLGPSGASLPLRLAGGLHALVLDGADAGLASVYPPHSTADDALWSEVSRALSRHEARLLRWLDSPPQTNEVRRSAALIAAAHWVAGQTRITRFRLSELGASAGLNLSFDRYRLDAGGRVFGPPDAPVRLSPEWTGAVPDALPLSVADRAGVDLDPPDPARADDRLRLLAYLWPDQPERIALTRAAIAMADARPDRGDAAPWLAARLAGTRPGEVHMVYNTIAWQYFPEATQGACRHALDRAGARATPGAPLVHVAMEADGAGPGAGLTAVLWTGTGMGRRFTLGRADFHGRWIHWTAA